MTDATTPPPQPALRRWTVGAAVAAAVAALAWLAGLVWFASLIPATAADDGVETDAIVVLTGGGGRLAAGLDLLARGRARKLLVSGVYRGVDVARLLEVAQRTPAELACCVEIGHAADDTAGNAAETLAWMRSHGFASLRIVTASYHMPRGLFEFRRALPEARLVAHPVFAESFKRERWWAWPGTLALVVSEYGKYVWARLVHGVGGDG